MIMEHDEIYLTLSCFFFFFYVELWWRQWGSTLACLNYCYNLKIKTANH